MNKVVNFAEFYTLCELRALPLFGSGLDQAFDLIKKPSFLW
jgi:hypothetical protein